MQVDEGQRLVAVDFDEGEIFFLVAGDVARFVALVVVRDDLDFEIGRALHHVLVSHNVTGRIDEEPGAETLQASGESRAGGCGKRQKTAQQNHRKDRAPAA